MRTGQENNTDIWRSLGNQTVTGWRSTQVTYTYLNRLGGNVATGQMNLFVVSRIIFLPHDTMRPTSNKLNLPPVIFKENASYR